MTLPCDFGKQIRRMYLFAAQDKKPIYYRLINGNIPDVSSMSFVSRKYSNFQKY